MGFTPSSSKSGLNDAHVAKIVTIDEARAKGAVRSLGKQKNEGKGAQKGAKGRGRLSSLSSRKEFTIARGAYREGALYGPSEVMLADEPTEKRRSIKGRGKRKTQPSVINPSKKPQDAKSKKAPAKTRALNKASVVDISQDGIPTTELRSLKTVSLAKSNQSSAPLTRSSLSLSLALSPSRALSELPASDGRSIRIAADKQTSTMKSDNHFTSDGCQTLAISDMRPASDRQASSKDGSEDDAKKKRPTVKNARKAARAEEKAAKKKARAKAKADKLFNATYDDSKSSGGSGGASADEGAGSRAALYKGEMGSSQKKSAKLQVKSSSGFTGLKRRFSGRKVRPNVLKVVASVAIVAVCAVSLYGPAQQYYQQMRETDRLQAELEAVAARTNDLQDQINVLGTDAGVEDKAHKDMGYVKNGEQTAKVRGITFDDNREFTSNVVPNSVPAPETWYSPVLDVIFGYNNLPGASS